MQDGDCARTVLSRRRSSRCMTGPPHRQICRSAIEIVCLYGLHFDIEHMFEQAVRLIGSASGTLAPRCSRKLVSPMRLLLSRRSANHRPQHVR